MKKTTLYFAGLIAVLALLFVSCEKVNPEPETEEETEQPEVEENRRTWKASAYNAVRQRDGKIVCLGLLGKAGHNEQTDMALFRLKEDGELDESYDTSHLNEMWAGGLLWQPLAIQPDDKVLLGGTFYIEGKKHFLIRLMPDGKLDEEFIANSNYEYGDYPPRNLSLTPSGDIYAVYIYDVVRLKQDGSVDESFYYELGFDVWNRPALHAAKQLEDGKLLLLGNSLILLKNDGKLDQSFYFRYKPIQIDNSYSYFSHVEIQHDGKLLVTGKFDEIVEKMDEQKAYRYTNIARFSADGDVDESFKNFVSTPGTYVTILPDGTYLYPVTTSIYDNDTQQILRHVDTDGKVISEKHIAGWISKIIPVGEKKILLIGNFFEKYDNISLVFDPYAADNRPVIEIDL